MNGNFAHNSFFNSFEITVSGILECSKHKANVQFLMYTFKKCKKYEISKKILEFCFLTIFKGMSLEKYHLLI